MVNIVTRPLRESLWNTLRKILLAYLYRWLFKPVDLIVCDGIFQSRKFVDHWFTFKFWIQWNTNTKQNWWDNRSRSTGLDDHLAPDSETRFCVCGRTNCFEQYPWTIEWPILVCLSLLAVKFALKVLCICGNHCCMRSLSRICSKDGELLMWYWSIWQHVWQYEHSPLQYCFVCQCTTCHLWCG